MTEKNETETDKLDSEVDEYGGYSPDEIERMRQVADGYKDVPGFAAMTVDEALVHVDGLDVPGYGDTGEAARVLAAEVRRLRADVARLNKENDDWHEASKQLRAELGQVKADNESGALAYKDLVKALAERNRELAETKHLLAEERALTAATVGGKPEQSGPPCHPESRWLYTPIDAIPVCSACMTKYPEQESPKP